MSASRGLLQTVASAFAGHFRPLPDVPTVPVEPRRSLAVGQRYGRGEVIELVRLTPANGRQLGSQGARLRCDCGSTWISNKSHLLNGESRSCGCLSRELTSKRLAARDVPMAHIHGKSRHPLYETWRRMNGRCYRTTKGYELYGGRGIKVYEPWHSLPTFIEQINNLLGERPPGYALTRKDKNGDFIPENVVWAGKREQIAGSRRIHRD